MKELITYFFSPDTSAEIINYQIKFAFNTPTWVIAFLMILAGAYSYWIYKKEAEFVNPWFRRVMSFFRFLVYCFFILLLLQPVIQMDQMVKPKSNLAIVIDQSESMSIVEQGADQAYFANVKKALEGTSEDIAKIKVENLNRTQIVEGILNSQKAKTLKDLADKFSLQFFLFGKEISKLDVKLEAGNFTVKLPEKRDEVTQLGSAERSILNYFKGQPLAGMVIFTDGGNNKGEDPEIVSQALKEKLVPVFPVGIGFPESIDINIIEVNIAELLFKDEDVAVEVRFKASSLAEIKVPVNIKLVGEKGTKELGKFDVVCKDGFFKKEFVIKPTEIGKFSLEVSVPQQEKEFFIDNNRLSKQIRVIDSKIRILFAVENPSWEYRYLKGMLNTDERIDTKVFIKQGDLRRSQFDKDFIKNFPKTREELNKNYDCVILNNLQASSLSTAQLEAIKLFVAEDGGSFIMFAATSGTPGTYLNTPIEDLLPVKFKDVSQGVEEDKEKRFTKEFKLRLTKEGVYHNITRLVPLLEENEKLWTTLPSNYWYYTGIEKLKPAAIALVEHSSAGNANGPIPLITQQRYGKGQVLFIGLNSMWRWRYKIGNKYFNKFWAQTIQFMGLPHLLGTMERVQYTTEGKEFMEGQLISVGVKILTPEFVAIHDEQITLNATNKESGATEQFKFAGQAGKPGCYEGQIALKKGEWNIKVEKYESEGELKLLIRKAQLEFENPAMQKSLLEKIAVSSGGEFIAMDQISKLPEKISQKVTKVRQQSEFKMWDNWLFLLLITLLAGIEWAIRKKTDLP
jgi:hypothetical protein